MRAMLVAAGLGTRLSPLTDLLPKPAVPVAGRPVAAYVMATLAEAGVTEFVANAFHLPDALERALRPHVPAGTSLTIVREPSLLGTGGGVRHAIRPEAGEDILVANAKVLFDVDVRSAVAAHRTRNAFATMVLRAMPPGATLGPVDVAADGRVVGLLRPQRHPAWQRCMFTGVQVLSSAAHHDLPPKGCAIRDGYARWLADERRVFASVQEGAFIDVGTSIAAYHDANMQVLAGRPVSLAILPDGHRNVVALDAHVSSGAMLRQTVVGEGATVSDGVRLTRCVVWPGTRVLASATDQVLTPNGFVRAD